MNPSESVAISRPLNLRECGFDEAWLLEQISGNPFILGLGDLDTVARQQVNDGKFDLLLKDIEDHAMYEVGILVGDMDEGHIIRTIEYWDYERKRWPNRQHFAVLVAEGVSRRLFNVIQLLGMSVPLIVIQANLIDADGKHILHFTKVLDMYEKGSYDPAKAVDDQWWKSNPWNAEVFERLVTPVMEKLELGLTKNPDDDGESLMANLEKQTLRDL